MIEKTVSRFITEFKKEYGEDALEIKETVINKRGLIETVKKQTGIDVELFIIKKSGTIHCYSVIWLNNENPETCEVGESTMQRLIKDINDSAAVIIVKYNSGKIVITYYEIN